MRDAICRANPRFAHYFYLENGYEDIVWLSASDVDDTLRACEEWHRNLFTYDVALSFAHDDRTLARDLANGLADVGVRVFFDETQQGALLGADLFVTLHEVYSERSRYCVMLISKAYASRMWTIHERRAAQERTLRERGAEYILPVRIDSTELRGLPTTIGYISASDGVPQIVRAISSKLSVRDPSAQKERLGRWLFERRDIYEAEHYKMPHDSV